MKRRSFVQTSLALGSMGALGSMVPPEALSPPPPPQAASNIVAPRNKILKYFMTARLPLFLPLTPQPGSAEVGRSHECAISGARQPRGQFDMG